MHHLTEGAINYYEHHIGDYAEATGHLSFVEDAAYSRLIRKYYASESPLPEDLKQVQLQRRSKAFRRPLGHGTMALGWERVA